MGNSRSVVEFNKLNQSVIDLNDYECSKRGLILPSKFSLIFIHYLSLKKICNKEIILKLVPKMRFCTEKNMKYESRRLQSITYKMA